jgi:hypothetical protein
VGAFQRGEGGLRGGREGGGGGRGGGERVGQGEEGRGGEGREGGGEWGGGGGSNDLLSIFNTGEEPRCFEQGSERCENSHLQYKLGCIYKI